ncbi:hypothetical protein B0H11DRAFT_606564 [Mycena galericulata]|nr:hypothetical protein B0H11DRAFT_606564 [Mycena galericulata]
MRFVSVWILLTSTLFPAGCPALAVPAVSECVNLGEPEYTGTVTHEFCRSCTIDTCRPARRSVDRPPIRDYAHSQTLHSRSVKLDISQIIVISSAIVGALAVCGVLAILLWYRRVNSAFFDQDAREGGFVEIDEKVPPSPQYIAPPPRIYAERWASFIRSTTFPIAQPSVASTIPPDLSHSMPAHQPKPLRSWNLKRVPVPRLSRLPSVDPRASLARIRVALRPPRRQDFKGPPRSSSLRPKPKQPPSPLPIIQDDGHPPSSPAIPSGIPSALPSTAPLTSRLTTVMNRIQSEYNVG